MNNPSKDRVLRLILEHDKDAVRIDDDNAGNSWVYKLNASSVPYAIKILRRFDRYERFREEVRIANDLSLEKGICPLIKFNLPEIPGDKSLTDLPYFTMPFFEDGSLARAIKVPAIDGGIFAMGILKQICNAIGYLHGMNFAHRDLKPENILLNSDEILVSDFGLCLDLTKDSEDSITHSLEIVGSFYYRAPEYMRGRLDSSDHRPGDVFSLGRILWSMLTGRQPLGMSDWEFSKQVISGLVEGLRKPNLLSQLIADCTHVDPLRRPKITEILEIINEWQSQPEKFTVNLVKERILQSAHLIQMKNNQYDWATQIANTKAMAGIAREAINNHMFFQKLQEIMVEVYPEQILTTESGVTIFPYLTEEFYTNPENVVSISFNLGNLLVSPLLMLQCNFETIPGNGTVFEIAACSVDKSEHTSTWSLSPLQFLSLDSLVMIKIQQTVDLGMETLRNWLVESIGQ